MFNIISTHFFLLFSFHLITILQGDLMLPLIVKLPLAIFMAMLLFFYFQFKASGYLFVMLFMLFVFYSFLDVDSFTYLFIGVGILWLRNKCRSISVSHEADLYQEYKPAAFVRKNNATRAAGTIVVNPSSHNNDRYYEEINSPTNLYSPVNIFHYMTDFHKIKKYNRFF